MFCLSKTATLSAIILSLCLGHNLAIASGNTQGQGDGCDQQNKRLATVQQVAQEAIVLAKPGSAGVSQTEFLPLVSAPDMKRHLGAWMCQAAGPHRMAQVCKAWHQFILGAEFLTKAKANVSVIPCAARSLSAQKLLQNWCAQRDLQILNSGIFRYQPEGSEPIDVRLSTMGETNGDLVLPAGLMIALCVTRRVETFVRPVGDNKRKTLVLLLTRSELENYAQQISADASFLENVGRADLSQNAVCALIRYGGDNLAEWGFRYTLLMFKEMNNLSVWEIYTHDGGARCVGLGSAGANDGRRVWRGRFCFLNPN